MGDLTPLIQEVEVEGEMKRALGADLLEGASFEANGWITLGIDGLEARDQNLHKSLNRKIQN